MHCPGSPPSLQIDPSGPETAMHCPGSLPSLQIDPSGLEMAMHCPGSPPSLVTFSDILCGTFCVRSEKV